MHCIQRAVNAHLLKAKSVKVDDNDKFGNNDKFLEI